MRSIIPILLFPSVLAPAPLTAQVVSDDSIARALRETGSRLETPRVVLWVGEGALSSGEARGFAEALTVGIGQIERILGAPLDTAHYAEDRIEVFVAEGVGVSHVYGSYQHMRYDKPYLYLDAEKVRSGEAPYLHELTHILAWTFGSHSLREGLASFVEATIRAEAGSTGAALFGATSPAAVDQQAAARLSAPGAGEVLPWIGKTGFAPGQITSPERPKLRSLYYVLSQSLVQHLVASMGMEEFLAVYAAPDPERALHERSGRRLEEWKREWQRTLVSRFTSAERLGQRDSPTAAAL